MWYALFVMTGEESYVIDFLNRRMLHDSNDVQYRFFHPTRKLVHLKQGKKITVSRALFPGYLFFETENVYYLRNQLRHCSKYLTTLKNADFSLETVRQDEVDGIMVLLNALGEIEFSTGVVEKDRVRIVSGPLMNYCVEILKINKRECKAKIQLNFLGNQIITHVGLNVLEKVEDKELLKARDFHFVKTVQNDI